MTRTGNRKQLVAFSGLPVDGGTGFKRAIFFDPASGTYVPDGGMSVKEPEFLASVEQNLATRLSPTEVEAEPHGVVVYAQKEFLRPGDPKVRLDAQPLVWDEIARSFVAYVDARRAEAIHVTWANALVDGAAKAWSQASDTAKARIALDAARRARFCTLSRTTRTNRMRVLEMMLAATEALGGDGDAIVQDARLDFDANDLKAMRRGAYAILTRVPQDRSPVVPAEFIMFEQFPASDSAPRHY